MKRYEIISQAIISKLYSFKNKFFKKRIREGLESESCEKGYFDNGDGQCLKEIETIEIFFKKPLVVSVLIFLLAFLSSGFLYKVKSMPLISGGNYCKKINLDIYFNNFSEIISGKHVILDKKYITGKDGDILGKILFPFFPSKKLFPPPPEDEDEILFSNQCLAVTRSCLLFLSRIIYLFLGTIKQKIYGNKFWGTLPEITQEPNKEIWVKDLITIFPALIFFLFFIFFLIGASLIMPMVLSGIWIGNIFIHWWTQLHDGETIISELNGWEKTKTILWVLWSGFIALLGTILIFLCNAVTIPVFIAGWLFLNIGFGFHESKRDGIKTVFQTCANVIWDYKFLWALIAILFWTSSFETYLKGSSNSLSELINEEHMGYLPPIISAIAAISLLSLQRKYFVSLKPTPQYNKSCTPNCHVPAMTSKEKGATKDCPPNSF